MKKLVLKDELQENMDDTENEHEDKAMKMLMLTGITVNNSFRKYPV